MKLDLTNPDVVQTVIFTTWPLLQSTVPSFERGAKLLARSKTPNPPNTGSPAADFFALLREP
jgi:hypothetical protein